jgi:hypothetical protein
MDTMDTMLNHHFAGKHDPEQLSLPRE